MSRNKNVSLKCPICKFPNDKGDRQIDDLRKQITVLKAENAELREALEHYADRQTWACGNTGYLHECGCDGQKTGDCSKCYYNSYQGDGQGWETAQAVLDKYKEK